MSDEHVCQYSIAVAWYGLLDQCYRDVLREADGPAIISFWRINFLRFWQGNHYKYLIIAHRLLAG